ncbi:MAG: hypothetical protein WB524_26035 [Acidobacteriaceae bacterium]|jgi:hypothetical protein
MGVDYAWEKFHSEIRFALASTASLQERLGSVISGVCHLQRDNFADEHVWAKFRKLINETTKREAHNEAEETFHTATSHLSDEKAKECLRDAVDIFSDIAIAYGKTEFSI